MRRDDKWNVSRRTGRIVCGLILVLLVLVVLLLVFTFCGCQNTSEFTEPEKNADMASSESVSGMVAVAEYQYMLMSEPLNGNLLRDYTINGDWLYFSDTIDKKEEGGDPYYTQVSRKRISDGYQENGYIISAKSTWQAQRQLFFADRDGNCYIFWRPGIREEDEKLYSMTKYGIDGGVLWSADYTTEEFLGLEESLEPGVVTEDGRVFLYHYGKGGHVFAFGQEGILEEVYIPELEVLEGVAAGKDGRVYGYCITGEEPVFVELGGTGRIYTCPIRPLEVYSGYESGICLRTGEGMWRYVPETGETAWLWGWEDEYVQMDGGRIDRFFCDGQVFRLLFQEQLYYDNHYTRQLLTFAAVSFEDRGEYPGKEVITLSSQSPDDYYLDILVKLYNRQSTRYCVEVVREESAREQERKLLQGEAADIIDLSLLYADNLAESGAFEDLTAYYEASSMVDWEDILEPVREGCVIRGRNVAVIPVFCIETMLEKESWYTAEDWNVWEFLGMGQGRQALPSQDPMEALRYCMGLWDSEHFLDYETRECHFDGGEFGRILEECSKWEDYNKNAPVVYYDNFLSGDHVLQNKHICSVWDVVSDTDPEYSARIVGYPGWEHGEHKLYAFTSFAMNSRSGNKEGAWDFLEFLLSDGLQGMAQYWYTGFPAREDQFEAHLADLYINPALLQPSFIEGIPTYEPVLPTDKDIILLRKIIDSAVYRNWDQSNNPVWNIISEEAGMYFAGDCPLEETVRKIQNRVQTYLDEL